MYDTNICFGLTKSTILRFYSEYEIFSKYLGFNPIVNKLYNSPFRSETKPSFGIFQSRSGMLLFKDLGSGDSGDCFKFACSISNKLLPDILKEIYYKLDRTLIKVPVKIPISAKIETEIAVNEIPFSKEALDYWTSYGITITTLLKFKVSEVSKFWINGVVKGWKAKTNLIFAYEVFDKYKIYKPFDKINRFITNCSIAEIQGWEQLDYSKEVVFITKSLKDIMLLHELGYTAISPGGEGQSLPAKALKILRSKFKHIIVFYDRDKAGMINTRKMIKFNNDFGFIFTPDKHFKDLSDYYKQFGKDTTIEMLNKRTEYSINHHTNEAS